MRLLYLADAVFADLPGGSKMVAWQLGCRLVRRGHEVTFLVPAHDAAGAREEERDGVQVIRYANDSPPLRFIGAGRAACRRLWTHGPFDLVHTHFAYAGLGPLQAIPPSVPRVRGFYGFWDEEGWVQETRLEHGGVSRLTAVLKQYGRGWVERRDLWQSDAVVAMSDYSIGLLSKRGVSPARLHCLPPGVDSERFHPPPDKAAIRRELGLPTDRRLLLSVRRLVPRMGLDNLIAAMPAIVAHRPDALLLIGGQGPERERLQAQIGALGLSKYARLIGFLPDDRLADYYGAADLFVLPTVALEGFGLVTLEALACGVPVVGTPVGATPEILRQVDGRLITRDATPDALADAICRFWAGDGPETLTARRLHDFARGRYPWDAHIAGMEQLYAGLCDRRGPIRGE